jgi:hypothetical protein
MPEVVAMQTMEPDTEKEFQVVAKERATGVIEQSNMAGLV